MNNIHLYLAPLILINSLPLGAIATTKELASIFLRLYDGSTMNMYIDQPLENASLLATKIEGNKPTMLYIHGFTESLESKSVATIIRAYLKRNDHNLIGVDYRKIAGFTYPKAALSAGDVGTAVAGALDKMVEHGLDPSRLHIVGHSLGAQVAGYVGRNSSFEVPRITGLDPAGPLFHLIDLHLTASDARFVDIIHTDYGFYGIARTTGDVDFFPNGGRRVQPGCPTNATFFSNEDFCSHHRSWLYYAESVLNEAAFTSVKCSSQFQYSFGECAENEKTRMGFATPSNAAGSFYLKTANKSPYSLKEQ
ncbi:hypothetical protein KM043_006925 [Ampulex compressa]|nr:hypothetical protein KM043_006925 [Ampulex compressa]